MTKKIVWLVVSGLMALSLVMAACGPALVVETEKEGEKKVILQAEEEEEAKKEVVEEEVVSPEKSKYGGTLTLARSGDITAWDDVVSRTVCPGVIFGMTNEPIWAGDWAKGPAGGYGTGETDWASYYDRFEHKSGRVAESWSWTVDEENNQGTIVYQIRQGMHYAINPEPWAEASRLVGGREVTADDVVFSLKQLVVTDERAYIYRSNPELRVAEITKTGPWEVSITVPLDALFTGIGRLGNYGRVVPPEVVEKYGDMAKWKNSVGSGPFMLRDSVAGSTADVVRNPNYWGTFPVGPDKGDQMPYLDGYRNLIIPDISTRQAALRTGKIDQLSSFNREDAATMRNSTPELLELETPGGGGTYTVSMRGDMAPFNDVRVRRAMMMATDFQAIVDGIHGGRGQILTWPYAYNVTYDAISLGLDDPAMPASVKELYTYNPTRAKELLAEAGYPDGFKALATITATQVDHYSIIKDMWSKVGVNMELDVKETGAWRAIMRTKDHNALAYHAQGPVSMWYTGISIMGDGPANASMIDDPLINETMSKIRVALVVEGESAGMAMYKEMLKYILDQAFTIPATSGFSSRFWWPWIGGYSGEYSVGFAFHDSWTPWVWLDQDLKESMGY